MFRNLYNNTGPFSLLKLNLNKVRLTKKIIEIFNYGKNKRYFNENIIIIDM